MKRKKPLLIAEIGINHNGSLKLAKELILKAKDCGFDYVKFQKRDLTYVFLKKLSTKKGNRLGVELLILNIKRKLSLQENLMI